MILSLFTPLYIPATHSNRNCVNLPDVVVSVFEKGLKDNKSDNMQDTVLVVSMEYLSVADGQQLDHC